MLRLPHSTRSLSITKRIDEPELEAGFAGRSGGPGKSPLAHSTASARSGSGRGADRISGVHL